MKQESKNLIIDLIMKIEDKNFRNINKKFNFSFPSNFMFINQDFLDVINDYIDKEYSKHLRTIFNTVVGGDCLIMKNPNYKNDDYPFRYIVLYSEINENKGNEINFFLFIKDKNERDNADNYILTNDLWNYFKKINYDYKEEHIKIKNEKGEEIGYIVRCCPIEYIETYKDKMEQKKKPENNFYGNSANRRSWDDFFRKKKKIYNQIL